MTAPKTKVSRPSETIATLKLQNCEELKRILIEVYEKTKPELQEKLTLATTIFRQPFTYLLEMLSVAKRIGISDDIVR